MGRLLLVLGGARSGKSAYAQRLAQELGGDHVLFVATAEAWDEDMVQRIARHRQERPATWRTLETPRQGGPAISLHLHDRAVLLIDCLTLLVSNTLLHYGASPDSAAAEAAVQEEVAALVQTCQTTAATWIVVSNEFCLGLFPDKPLDLRYRVLLGKPNWTLAAQAEAVYFMVAGLPVDVKALASPTLLQSPGPYHTP